MTEDEGRSWDAAVRAIVDGPVKPEGRGLVVENYRFFSTPTTWIKVQHGPRADSRRQDLAGEAAQLRRAAGIRGIPRVIAFGEVGDFAVLETERVEGLPFGMRTQTSVQYALTLMRLSWTLVRLAFRGLSHNDLTPGNILVDAHGRPSLIDFDQTASAPRSVALRSMFLGGRRGELPVSLRHLLDTDLRRRAPGLIARLSRLKRRFRPSEPSPIPPMEPIPDIPADAPPSLFALRDAWNLAAASKASAPDRFLAYYSLTVDGIRFPGERVWEPRWTQISQTTELQGRRILELGCNMGLLSTFAAVEGASGVLGVDHDEEILAAARLVASAYGVPADFRRVDFDDPDDWESELLAFAPDVVFALNVVHWLQDRDRFFRFLGQSPEVVFEGHDPYAIEAERLRQVGFTDIKFIGWSERARAILRARR